MKRCSRLNAFLLLLLLNTGHVDVAQADRADAVHEGRPSHEASSFVVPLLQTLDPLARFDRRLQMAGIIPRNPDTWPHSFAKESILEFSLAGRDLESYDIRLRRGHIEAALRRAFKPLSITMDQGLVYALRSDFIPSGVYEGDWVEIRLQVDEEGRRRLVSLNLHLAASPTPIRMYRLESRDKRARYFDPQGFRYQPRLLNSPLDYMTITSYLGDGRNHKGLDLQAPTGTPVRTPFKAVVEGRSWSRYKQGLALQLLYVDLGIRARFFHLSRIQPDIKIGQTLEPGDIIALSGNTGHSTGPHLHYQLEDAVTGAILDPLRVHGYGSERLDPDEQRVFEAWTALVDAPLSPSAPPRSALHVRAR